MPTSKRERREPTEARPRLAELAAWPEQRAYEELRPVVLFGQSVEERARETATAERTLYRRAARFDAAGMRISRCSVEWDVVIAITAHSAWVSGVSPGSSGAS